MRLLLTVLLALFLLARIAPTQEAATFTIGVNVVNVLANVLDKHGAIVRDLAQDDFAILEDGRPQMIRYFARQTDLPLTVGLLVDTSMSQERVLAAERTASFRFLDQVLREKKDRIFIVQFDLAVLTRQPLTSSYQYLNDALSQVDTPTRRELQNGGDRGTLLFDAVVQSSDQTMAKQRGRKALILLTDGDDNGSDATLQTAIDAAQRADTLIFSILFSDSGVGHGPGRTVLERLARETGGGFFEVSKNFTIERIFDVIQDELRSQYSLGYVSDKPPTAGEFRKIQLRVAKPGLRTQARDRYFAQP